ncbi:hypothetical protein C3B51_08940 [Pseudoalteromonas rubra]|uniref:Uncharacterized protein n=1 Tax=Pseudoalteromonas rubra TaxID=43658 RepID=A0A4Q7EDY0_9GAMM|nr:hypothetical protein [Pseudoalteromonas rubra]RZM81296.1 hypothetical protein C3B51_08940 [Pseudoalteromonas rubra]
MPNRTTIEILKGMNSSDINKVVEQLNREGAFTDECDLTFQSTAMEAWDESCTSYLADNGYSGGYLKLIGQYFPEVGSVYVIYDSDELNSDEALDFAKKIVNLKYAS